MKPSLLALIVMLSAIQSIGQTHRGAEVASIGGGNDAMVTKAKNIALVIGTNNYANWKHLDNPVFDAKTIKEELESKYDYQVIYLENPTRAQILKELFALHMKFQNNDYGDNSNFLFFLAGHGGDDDFVNGYLVPSDAKSSLNDTFKESCIKHDELRGMIENIKAKHTLVVLDACFGGAFDQLISSRGENDGQRDYPLIDYAEFIREKTPYKSRKYLTSGGKEYVPDGTPGHHSPFAFRFIELLREGYDNKHMLTFHGLCSGLEMVKPQARAGEFGYNDPNSDFILVPVSVTAPDRKRDSSKVSPRELPADTKNGSQADASRSAFAIIVPDKMNCLYVGVPNPVSIGVSGIDNSKIQVSISQGEIKGSNGHYIVSLKERGAIKVTVSAELEKGVTTVIGSCEFRAKTIPPPHVKFAGKSGGNLNVGAMKSQNKIFAIMEDFDFEAEFKISHFSLLITNPNAKEVHFESNSNKFTPEMESAMASIVPGSHIIFNYVFATGPDGMKRALDPIVFNCE